MITFLLTAAAFVIIFPFWALIKGTCAAINAAEKRQREKAIEAERQSRMERLRQIQTQRELEARQAAIEREQKRQAEEQERLRKEQEKQAEILAKHEKKLAELDYKISQAESDIKFYRFRLDDLCAQLDFAIINRDNAIPGTPTHERYQSKIITLENQIHTAEGKLDKARHNRKMAQMERNSA